MFRIVVKNSYEEVSKEANKYIRNLLVKKPNSVLGLATGSSPIGLYKQMIVDFKAKVTDYSQVVTFNLDEYIGLPNKHPESYISFMQRNLFSHINIQARSVHIPYAHSAEDNKAGLKYEELLSSQQVDIQVLGIGANGHIGFNEPGTPFNSITHITKLAKRTRLDNQRFFNSLEEVPTHAITMGIATIMKSKEIVLIACGSNKAQAVYDMINGPITEDTPASILQQHQNVIVILDEEANSKL